MTDYTGTAGPDNLGGGFGPDRLWGLGGSDTLFGGEGSDTLDGGDGDDRVVGWHGDDSIVAGAGSDSLSGGDGADSLVGGAGDDTLSGGLGADSVDGGAGADWILLDGGADTIRGGDGVDVLVVPRARLSGGGSDIATMLDWQPEDRLVVEAVRGRYAELVDADVSAARVAAHGLMQGEVGVVAAQVGSDVYIFARALDGPYVGFSMRLAGAKLGDFSEANLGIPSSGGLVPPELPAAPYFQVSGFSGWFNGMERFNPVGLADLEFDVNAINIEARGAGVTIEIRGEGFTVGGTGQVETGTYRFLRYFDGTTYLGLSTPPRPIQDLTQLLTGDWSIDKLKAMLSGNDALTDDSAIGWGTLWGYGGNDVLTRGRAMFGGEGNDVISQPRTNSYLRGEEGDDYIVGSGAFDDINGNMGNDTASGGGGADWVVGGKDDDLLFGDAGDDIVYGNLGADTCSGGDGNDIVRGGQGNDRVFGGAGNDFLAGDRGDDTLVGGDGADIFHTFAGADIDRVMDFRAAEGDRVQVAAGTSYTVAQVGADTVISTDGGSQMTLVGVNASQLPPGWIFTA